ncbi:MAG TPA: hypothetical protein VL551_28145 [Actinospica sp.]|jgi:hypothetical protein|nr:hypothetical protein [Actinospica sp.]
MPFTLMKSAAVNTAHAMAQGAEQHEAEDGDSQMASGGDKPMRDDDAEKAVRNHPDTGRFMATGETAHGASGAPIMDALARHQAPAPLASLATAPSVSLGSSIAPGSVTVQQLDYRQGLTPRVVNPSPVRPDFHQAPNSPGKH